MGRRYVAPGVLPLFNVLVDTEFHHGGRSSSTNRSQIVGTLGRPECPRDQNPARAEAVRIRSIEPYVPDHRCYWPALCYAQEATGAAAVEDRPPGGPRVQDNSCARTNGRACTEGILSL